MKVWLRSAGLHSDPVVQTNVDQSTNGLTNDINCFLDLEKSHK